MGEIRPLGERILVKRTEKEVVSDGGIFIPEMAQEKPCEGKIVAIGTGKISKNGDIIPLEVQVGDNILFSMYAGADISVDGEKFLIMQEDDVLAIIS